jgi:DNA-binding NarL/FixJ family response regulator
MMPRLEKTCHGSDGSGPIGPLQNLRGSTQQRLYFEPSDTHTFGVAKRILVIDDDARLREQYTEILRLEGYEVVEARNGREGVERARREPPDLVLCDITMPEMNGHRVLETLRAEPRTSHVPFVFLTGWSEREDVRTGMNLGADDYLTKPVVPDELAATIRARLRRAELAGAGGSGRKTGTSEAKPEQLEALGLTPREAEVLFWVARGKTNDEIATVLSIGLTTVKKHLESTYAKLGVENRTTAAAMALEQMGVG